MTRLSERFMIEDNSLLERQNEKERGTRRSHRKGITVPVARQRAQRTPWSESAERVQWEARRAIRGGLPFMAWDGEGVIHKDEPCNCVVPFARCNRPMSYVLLGHTAGTDDIGPSFTYDERLSTLDCLEYLIAESKKYKRYFHVSFGFGFDVDQMLRDIPDRLILDLKASNQIEWRKYRIFYIPRKIFSVSYMGRNKITIYDTLTFFNTNLIKTAEQYVPGDPAIPVVKEGKDQRDSFDYDELDSIIVPYWRVEGELMIRIMNALRHSMIGAGIHLEKWHGPGAIAEALIIQQKLGPHIAESRTETPNQVTEATAYAFFGGRFECKVIGDIPGPIYGYDINSAYPYALTRTGSLSGGQWVYNCTTFEMNGIYHVINHGHPKQHDIGMGPLPYRSDKGTVCYPFICEGWYYGPEIKAALISGWNIEILENWCYVDGDPSPFDFLHIMYLQRADYKREGNPAQLACKLGINSVYGKLAQLVGWDEDHNLPPKFHQQWYAGMATSWTRAMIWSAISQSPKSVIAIETDCIYSSRPLDLRIGEQLGEWELKEYVRMLYVQSGMYFARTHDDEEWDKQRTRGIPKGIVTIGDAFAALPTLSTLHSTQHRYGSLSGSLGTAKRFTWYDQISEIQWGGGNSKRAHRPDRCTRCVMGDKWEFSDMHFTTIVNELQEMSHPRVIPWLDGAMYVPPSEDIDYEDNDEE